MHSPATLLALAGALFVLPTLASPLELDATLSRRDVFVATVCDPLVYGAKQVAFGSVCAGIQDGTLTVVYSTDSGWTINDVHVLVGTTTPTETAPGQFPYKSDNGFCTISGTRATCTIPVQDSWRACDKDLYIATHIAATSSTGAAETGWGKGTCYDNKGNCAKYWTFTQRCQCPVVYEYEPAVTTSIVTYTTTSQTVYTVTFADETSTASCNDPKKGATQRVTTTKPIPAGWTPPAK
ncbi:uncharacterized protein LTR77_003330 [Saxophila tyrrhenica]|uniref:Uncharacterized protein n=1 Tax=Saxophila tyrrhenica TaxID=1690608 RepID=A0AAV9PLL2_9PEZI|nr:hypothetical protein LTR77_003330 [Saxophila tyrrhenica]